MKCFYDFDENGKIKVNLVIILCILGGVEIGMWCFYLYERFYIIMLIFKIKSK